MRSNKEAEKEEIPELLVLLFCLASTHKEEYKQAKSFCQQIDRLLIGSLAVLKMSDNGCRPSETRWSSLNITQIKTHMDIHKHIGSITTQTIQHVPLLSINELWKPPKTLPMGQSWPNG